MPPVVNKYKKDSEEFFQLVGRMANISPLQAKRQWNNFVEVIIRELYTGGMVRLPDMGYMVLKRSKAGLHKMVDKQGILHWFNLPERGIPDFKPEDDFINDVNMTGVTKCYQTRVRQNKLTPRDKERQRRAKEILGTDYQVNKNNEAIALAESTDEFNQLLLAKRQNYEEKLEKMLKEQNNGT